MGLPSRKRTPDKVSKRPLLLPKKKRNVHRQVFLPPQFWEELSEVADFHSDAFAAMGADERVSRNDIIESFLRAEVALYWEDVGGKPTTPADKAKKVQKLAEILSSQEEPK
jgi:hypothetical protein